MYTQNQLAVIKRAKNIILKNMKSKANRLTSPQETRTYLQLEHAGLEHEVFTVIFLDQQHHVITSERLFNGTIDGASVYPREVVKKAIEHNAAAVIFAHNHPSGVAEPSSADERITQRLKKALALIEVRALDHFVIGDDIISFAERGLM